MISLVDPGIIRNVQWHGDAHHQPGYWTALRIRDIRKRSLKQQLSPAWTTGRMTDANKAKLESYGIALNPPEGHNTARIANQVMWKRSASLVQPHARRRGGAGPVWNPLTASSASDAASICLPCHTRRYFWRASGSHYRVLPPGARCPGRGADRVCRCPPQQQATEMRPFHPLL